MHSDRSPARVFRESVLYSSTAAEHSSSNALILHDVISSQLVVTFVWWQRNGGDPWGSACALVGVASRRRLDGEAETSADERATSRASSLAVILWVWCEKTTADRDGNKLWGWSENILFEIQISQLARFRFPRFPNKRSSLHLATRNFGTTTTVRCRFVRFPGTFDLSYSFLFFLSRQKKRKERRRKNRRFTRQFASFSVFVPIDR